MQHEQFQWHGALVAFCSDVGRAACLVCWDCSWPHGAGIASAQDNYGMRNGRAFASAAFGQSSRSSLPFGGNLDFWGRGCGDSVSVWTDDALHLPNRRCLLFGEPCGSAQDSWTHGLDACGYVFSSPLTKQDRCPVCSLYVKCEGQTLHAFA